MALELVIPIVIFVALAVVFLVILRRIGLLVADSRESTLFSRAVEDLARRIDATLADMVTRIDLLRRKQIDVEEIIEPLDRALEMLLAYGEEARGLSGPPAALLPTAAFASEIDRADRALQMVEHGAAILGSVSSEHRYAEAQTAVKRGYLNVLHARDSIARHATEIAAASTPEGGRWYNRRRGSSGR